MGDEESVFCYYELARFPLSAFRPDDQGNLIHETEGHRHYPNGLLVDLPMPSPPPNVSYVAGQTPQTGDTSLPRIHATFRRTDVSQTVPTPLVVDSAGLPAVPADAPSDVRSDLVKMRFQAEIQLAMLYRQSAVEYEKLRLAMRLEQVKNESVADVDREKAAWQNEYTMGQAVQSAYLDVTKGGIDRSQTRAMFLERAAATIGTAYAALLGLLYKAGGDRGFPASGIIPTLFLSLSVVLAALYLSFITRQQRGPSVSRHPSLRVYQLMRLGDFGNWATAVVLRRRWCLHASVASLACGVALLPIPFLLVETGWLIALTVAAGAVLIGTPILAAQFEAQPPKASDTKLNQKRKAS